MDLHANWLRGATMTAKPLPLLASNHCLPLSKELMPH